MTYAEFRAEVRLIAGGRLFSTEIVHITYPPGEHRAAEWVSIQWAACVWGPGEKSAVVASAYSAEPGKCLEELRAQLCPEVEPDIAALQCEVAEVGA